MNIDLWKAVISRELGVLILGRFCFWFLVYPGVCPNLGWDVFSDMPSDWYSCRSMTSGYLE